MHCTELLTFCNTHLQHTQQLLHICSLCLQQLIHHVAGTQKKKIHKLSFRGVE